MSNVRCIYCRSTKCAKDLSTRGAQQYKCKVCNKYWVQKAKKRSECGLLENKEINSMDVANINEKLRRWQNEYLSKKCSIRQYRPLLYFLDSTWS